MKKNYIEQLEGFVVARSKVFQLQKALYSQKQVGCQWFLKLQTSLKKLRSTCYNTGNVSIFICHQQKKELEIFVFCVDNLTFIDNSLVLINNMKEALCKEIDLTNMGELKHYFGICITQDRESYYTYLK